MCNEEIKLLQMLEHINVLGITAASLPERPELYNSSAEAMVDCARIYLQKTAASLGEPVDHFANEAAMDMLRHLDRLSALRPDERLPYFRTSAKNVCFRYIAQRQKSRKYQFRNEFPVPSAENIEEMLLRRELIAALLSEASHVLTLREFYAFFYLRVVGLSPGELEAQLASCQPAYLVRNLIRQLCDLYRIPESVFAPLFGKKERKGGMSARSITQAAQRAGSKIRNILSSL